MTDKKLNILFLASWYPNTESTQAGNFIQQHAKAVAEFVNVSVIYVVAKQGLTEQEVSINQENGIYEVIVYYPKVTSSTPIISLKEKKKRHHNAYLKAYEIAKKEFCRIDLVHLNVVYPAGLFAIHLKEKENIPYILTEHWTAFLKSTNYKFSTIEKHYIKKIANSAELICPVSENLKQNIEQFGIKNKFQVIPNVVDTTIFSYKEKEPNAVKEILHISNLKDEHKNITGILKVVKQLSTQRDDFHITIAGNGDTEHFKKKSEGIGIEPKLISFKGEMPPQDVASLMQQSDLFLLFSNYENLPCVIAESLVMGKPVISTNVGGIAEMIDNSNGIPISAGNETELLDSLNAMLDNIGNYNCREIGAKANKIYSQQVVGKSYYNIYLETLKQ